MKPQTLWLIGGGVALAAGYYFFVYKPKQLAPAPAPAPGSVTLTPPGVSVTPPAGGWGLPPVAKPVKLTAPLSATDVTNGSARTFNIGDVIKVYGLPVAGMTTFMDSSQPPRMYATQEPIAGFA